MLTAGCAVGPDYVRPETATAETWSDSLDASLSTDPVEYGRWWTVFEDPALEQLIEISSRENLPLQIAAARILEARAVLGISRGSRFPQQQQQPGEY
jgi:multidrug efflux system outer membrane protein